MRKLALILFGLPLLGMANDVSILEVEVECPTTCTFRVTLEHADEGWHHYADRWDVLTLDDRLLKTRVLHHPHVNEQPFTRSLSGVAVPEEHKQVKIRARDSKHGYSKQEFIVDLPGRN